MHKVSTFAALILLAGSTTLQAQHQPLLKQRPAWCANPRYEEALEYLAGPGTATSAANKATAASQRLTGIANYRDMGSGLQPSDTAWFRYSGNRTSKFDQMYLYYNKAYAYNTFKPDNLVDYDTSYYQGLGISAPPDMTCKLRNAAGNIIHYTEGTSQTSDYTYDAQGLPISWSPVTMTTWPGSG